MSAKEVRAVAGKPLKAIEHDGFIRSEVIYDGMVVKFDEDMLVAGIETTSKKHCLDLSICPGDSLKSAKKKVSGQKNGSASIAGKLTIYGDGCWTEISSKNESVASIKVRCQP
jgi:hypothetical protein